MEVVWKPDTAFAKKTIDELIILKRQFKHRWSTIPPISTKRTVPSHLNSLNTNKIMTYDTGNPGPGLEQA